MVSTRQSSSVANGSENGTSTSGTVDTSGIKTRNASHMSPTQELVPLAPTVPPLRVVTPAKQFLDLPVEIFDKIFSYTGYKTVSTLRLVNRQMDKICGSVLNSTFQKLQTQMLHRFQTIKAKMPRRESARRNHPLACESDIIETLHMRLTLLQMSFGKHIERKHCCFFPGEILDEVYRILHYVRVTPKLARPYRVTDELYDLSTMAMEYFKEHIEPRLPEIAYFGSDFFEFPGSLQNSSNNKSWLESPPHSGMKSDFESSGPMDCRSSDNQQNNQSEIFLTKRIKKIKQGMKKYNTQLAVVKKELKSCKAKMLEHQKQYHEHISRMDDYEKKNDETSRKFSTLLQELNKCKTELQYWRSKSPLSTLCASCGKRNEMSPEEIMLIAQGAPPAPTPSVLDDPQPSTSTSTSTSVPPPSSSWVTPCVPHPTEPSDDLKPKPVVPQKRKSVSDTPAAHSKRSKKPRPMLKVRSKRS